MRLLVIGGTGFTGRPLVRELARLGHEVAVLARSSAPTGLPAESIVGERGDLRARRRAAWWTLSAARRNVCWRPAAWMSTARAASCTGAKRARCN